jgi:hypothetical protein
MNDIQEKPTLINSLRWLKLSSTSSKIILTLHIIFSVGLLGESAGYLAVAIRASTVTDSAVALTSYQILQMFAFMFGIPLSFLALISGLVLALGTKWGVFRYPWVTTKLLLIISVILVGALVLKEGMDAMVTGRGGAEGRLITGAAYDVVALTVATVLGVFKPGRRWLGKALNQTVR